MIDKQIIASKAEDADRRSPVGQGTSMGNKPDIAQINAIAKEFGMDEEERFEFGDYIEDCKRNGECGSKSNGDFTYAELRQKAEEFRSN